LAAAVESNKNKKKMEGKKERSFSIPKLASLQTSADSIRNGEFFCTSKKLRKSSFGNKKKEETFEHSKFAAAGYPSLAFYNNLVLFPHAFHFFSATTNEDICKQFCFKYLRNDAAP